MEESSSPWSFLGLGARNPYFKIIRLLFVFSVFLLFNAHPATAVGPEKTPPSGTHSTPRLETVVNVGIAITPVRKKKSDRFKPMIIKAADRYQVDPALIKAIIMMESAYNPKAVSKQGAKGLMQLMPKTARALGVKDAFNPAHNINGGVKYLRQLLDAFDENITLALAAYNAGSSRVKRYGGIPPIKATRHYVKKVFAYYQHYKAQMAEQTETV